MGDLQGKLLGIGLLNPSTADEHRDDPTISRCRSLAGREGFRNLLVWNLFACRATDPAKLKRAADPVGPETDAAIELALALCEQTILAWGNHGRHLGRSGKVLARCAASGARLAVLGLTKRGEPRHPLYLSANVRPRSWKPPPCPADRSP